MNSFHSRCFKTIGALLMAIMVTVACSSGKPAEPSKSAADATINSNTGNGKAQQTPAYKANTDPVTITFYNAGNINSYYEQYIAEHIHKKMPNVTIDYIRQAGDITLTSTIASGTIPDVIYMVSTAIPAYKELGILGELDSLVKSHQVNMGNLLDGLEASTRIYGEHGELLYMPWGLSNWATYYNKDIFDRFAVEYLKDGMTWDDIYQKARQLTRTDSGVDYRGFDFNPDRPIQSNQLSMPFVDPKTSKAVVNTAGWKKLFETFGQFYKIPGNEPAKDRKVADFHTGKVAIIAGATQFPQLIERINKGEKLNVDIVSFPTFPEAPKTSLQTVTAGFAIPAQSKHRDQAMDIIQLMLSDEVQQEGAEILRLPVVKNKEVYKTLGQAYPELKSMNLGALTYNSNAVTKSVTEYDDLSQKVLNQKFDQYKEGKADVNTSLREAEEEINKKIAEVKQQ